METVQAVRCLMLTLSLLAETEMDALAKNVYYLVVADQVIKYSSSARFVFLAQVLDLEAAQ